MSTFIAASSNAAAWVTVGLTNGHCGIDRILISKHRRTSCSMGPAREWPAGGNGGPDDADLKQIP